MKQIMTDKELAEKYEEKIDYIEVNDVWKKKICTKLN